MAGTCFKCGRDLGLDAGARVGRRDSCAHCAQDIHCCKNCQHYDTHAYNECREPQADRVLEKEGSNFCDYFLLSAQAGKGPVKTGLSKADHLKKLDDLFKKS